MTCDIVVVCAAAAVASLTLAPSRPAQACSPPCRTFVRPTGGTVPANLPAVTWRYRGPQVTGDPVRVTEIDPDGTERDLPVTIIWTDGALPLARFDRPLVAGASYRVGVLQACGGQEPSYATTTFRAGASAPLPEALGTLSVGSLGDERRQVGTVSGMCTSEAGIVRRRVTLALHPSMEPWRHALGVAWLDEDGLGVSSLARDEPEPDDAWRLQTQIDLYRVCDSDDPGTGSGSPAGFTLEAVGSIRDLATERLSASATVALPCSGGCAASATSSSVWLALVMLALARAAAARRPVRPRWNLSA